MGQPAGQFQEFKSMVKELHRAGIEVILDVVYNHSGEGDHSGPTLSLRGIDNASYYRLRPDDRRFYEDVTGCGNSLKLQHPHVLRLVMDSLRYWVQDMHVDGFRFDLATALARGAHGMEHDGPFLAAVAQDPVLSEVKLIAEPWDLGPDGYQVGNFPVGWAEWNDKYRAAIRAYWRGDSMPLDEVSRRISGSGDLYGLNRRGPCASVNFITAHDGFTLQDLVSYEHKHNEANCEENRDGESHNLSRNWGVEGPTDDPQVTASREQASRNFLATLAFSLGVPMITAGDELGRTQRGNNNAYCQDNEISWVGWRLADWQERRLAFARLVFALRRQYAVLRRRSFFSGKPICDAGIKDVTWLRPDGPEMSSEDWNDPGQRTFGVLIHEHPPEEPRQDQARSQTLLWVANAAERSCDFRLPTVPESGLCHWLLNTARDETPSAEPISAETVRIAARSLALLEYRQVT